MLRFVLALALTSAMFQTPLAAQAPPPPPGMSPLENATRLLKLAEKEQKAADDAENSALEAAAKLGTAPTADAQKSAIEAIGKAKARVEAASRAAVAAKATVDAERSAAIQTVKAAVDANARPPVKDVSVLVKEKQDSLRDTPVDPKPADTCKILLEKFQSLRDGLPTTDTVSEKALLELRAKAKSVLTPYDDPASQARTAEWKPFLVAVFDSLQTPTPTYNPTDAAEVRSKYDEIIKGFESIAGVLPTPSASISDGAPRSQPAAGGAVASKPIAGAAGSIDADLKAHFDKQAKKLKDTAPIDTKASATCSDLQNMIQDLIRPLPTTGAIQSAALKDLEERAQNEIQKQLDVDDGRRAEWKTFIDELVVILKTSKSGVYDPRIAEQLRHAIDETDKHFTELRQVCLTREKANTHLLPNGGGASGTAASGGGGSHSGGYSGGSVSHAAVHHARVMNSIQRRHERRSYMIQRIYSR